MNRIAPEKISLSINVIALKYFWQIFARERGKIPQKNIFSVKNRVDCRCFGCLMCGHENINFLT